MKIIAMDEQLAARVATPVEGAGFGALRTDRGNLPLDRLAVRARITGLVAEVELTQEFVNVHDEHLEATYVFPLPDRAAVTGMTMTADGRVVEAELQERGQARENYDQAIAAGRRASIAEQERPDVFTMRVGNIVPGERVSVALRLTGPLSYEDGEATFRFPLVVAPRYIPGAPLPGNDTGDGYSPDTDAVPDASRITPPVLLPGFPNPLRLSIEVDIDPAGLSLGEVRSSLHHVATAANHLSVRPGERADRDFVLRLAYRTEADEAVLVVTPDSDGDEGTFQLTVLPPPAGAGNRPRDVVLLLDRSGSMGGWKMVAARRAAARIVDTLGDDDRFAVLAFDDRVETPPELGAGLVTGTDRHRFRAVEHLSRMDSRGGTELLAPLRQGLALLTDPGRDRVLVLVTDGQVGNEDQLLHEAAGALDGIRVHTVGIDRAVNAGFLGRLAAAGGGRCELVESEDRLDTAMDRIHRRIGAPVVTGLTLTADGFSVDALTPARLPDVFPGVPYVVAGRYRGPADGTLLLRGGTRDGGDWSAHATARRLDSPATRHTWARAHLRDLEDAYVAGTGADLHTLEQRIIATSLRFGVLCRFTAFVAVDTRVVNEGGVSRRVTQPVESPSGWEMFDQVLAYPAAAMDSGVPPMPPPSMPSPVMPMAAAPASAPYASRARAAGAGVTRPASLVDTRPDVTALVARELQRLREATDRPGYERRELLEDLGSRLAALGVPELDPLARSLRLEEIAERPLEELWEHTVRTLEQFLGATTTPPPPQRRAFWKR